MIDKLELKHVGPASSMQINFAPRLNILTGDNGMGKTFIMDIVWFVLTRNWPHLPAWPKRGKGIKPEIKFTREKASKSQTLTYAYKTQKWSWDRGGTPPDGLVLYARADGGVSVWDQAKNDATRIDASSSASGYFAMESLHFTTRSILDGVTEKDKVKCNGLIQDWVNWQFQKKNLFEVFTRVLEILSPNTLEIIRPGEPARFAVDDVRIIPTINLPYGNTPVTHTSAGMRRVLSLAYLMVWSWAEHLAASELMNQEPTRHLVLLFDEVEAHLHPQWQRTFMPALLEAMKILESTLQVRIIASTHAPLVLASLETEFDDNKDRIFNFELQPNDVAVHEIPWAKQGDVVNWLVSDTFGLQQARSKEAERAIEAAEAFMRNDMDVLPEILNTKENIHHELMRVLPGHDPFWPRWIVKTGEELA